jgi:transcriptional regulator with GAF, ATPase, and Fis domain
MWWLIVFVSEGEPRQFELVRSIATIGSSPDCDFYLPNLGLEPTHAQLLREGSEVTIQGMTRDLIVNGRRRSKCRLSPGDRFRLADLEFELRDKPMPNRAPTPTTASAATRDERLAAYRRIHEFSAQLMAGATTSELVNAILDGVIELTGADNGFLVLADQDGQLSVEVARDRKGAPLANPSQLLSDSILERVVALRKPIVVADALQDAEFGQSKSIVELRLLSVMCCPLLDQTTLHGLLYVGSKRLSHLFNDDALATLEIFASQASLLLGHARHAAALRSENKALKERLKEHDMGDLIAASPSMDPVLGRIRKVASTEIVVLITGETGTGKELVAREIHRHSRRSRGPFEAINCGAIPETLLESELFGHVRGAFTGAVLNKKGRFHAAHGGTLFLDEIGELPIALQVKLLRVLEDREVLRVGATQSEKIDIRILAATNRNLEDEVQKGQFREDLYYRLNVVQIVLPPLRERGEDVVTIARYLLKEANQDLGRSVKGFDQECILAMRKYRWPGNVRELQNRVKKAVLLTDNSWLSRGDLGLRDEHLDDVLPLHEARERFQAEYIESVLRRNGGNRTKTAKDLNVDPRTIFRHLARHEDGAQSLATETEVE